MKNIIQELKNILFDFLYFFSTKKGCRSRLSAKIGYMTLRIIIFSTVEKLYRFWNRKEIIRTLKKSKIKLSKNADYFTAKLDLDKKYINYLIDILEKNTTRIQRHNSVNKKNNKREFEQTSKNVLESHFVPNTNTLGGIEADLKNHGRNISQYINIDPELVGDLGQLFSSIGVNKFLKTASFMAGYPLKLSDLTFSINRSIGSNRNVHWHSDTFHSMIKGFIYLSKVEITDSPFEFCANSTDLKSILEIHQPWLANFSKKSVTNPESPRLVNRYQLNKTEKNKISFIGKPGTLIVANTSGLHRKGEDISNKERLLLYFEVKRLSLYKRVLRIFFNQ